MEAVTNTALWCFGWNNGRGSLSKGIIAASLKHKGHGGFAISKGKGATAAASTYQPPSLQPGPAQRSPVVHSGQLRLPCLTFQHANVPCTPLHASHRKTSRHGKIQPQDRGEKGKGGGDKQSKTRDNGTKVHTEGIHVDSEAAGDWDADAPVEQQAIHGGLLPLNVRQSHQDEGQKPAAIPNGTPGGKPMPPATQTSEHQKAAQTFSVLNCQVAGTTLP